MRTALVCVAANLPDGPIQGYLPGMVRLLLILGLATAAAVGHWLITVPKTAPAPAATMPASAALGRGTLDHSGQPTAALPGDDRVETVGVGR